MRPHTKPHGRTTDAYVHVGLDGGTVPNAVEEVAALENVHAVHTVTGECDAIAQLELASTEDIPDAVAADVHAIRGVLETVTHVGFTP